MGVFQTCKDLTGQVFTRLTVQNQAENSSDGHSRWLCLCECGKTTVVQSNNLRTKSVTSCGCVSKERASLLNLTHGMTKTKEFMAWNSMKERCYNSNRSNFKDYGGRGITVCQRWLDSFENFFTDMGAAPAKKYSIDRIENDGNYEPSNCRWATPKEQRANQRPKTSKK